MNLWEMASKEKYDILFICWNAITLGIKRYSSDIPTSHSVGCIWTEYSSLWGK